MLKYTFDECLQNLENFEINVSIALRTKILPTVHTHDFYEFLLPCENSFIHILNNGVRQMDKYDLCLITPTDEHYTNLCQDKVAPTYFTISVRAEYLENLAKLISYNYLEDVSKIHYSTLSPQLFEKCRLMLEEALFLPQSEIQKKQYLYQLVVIKLLTEFSVRSSFSSKHQTLVEQTKSIMMRPENMNLSIEEIAEKLGYSQEHIIRSFKKQGFDSPNKIFTKIKLDYTCELLCSTDYTVTKICEMVGFYSQHYFNQLFKRYFGLSPSNYRKKNANFI